MLLPFYWMVVSSLKRSNDVFTIPIEWWPETIVWRNYLDIWQKSDMTTWLWNTLLLSVIVTVLQVLTGSFAAYGFSKIRFPGRDFLFICYVGTIAVPWQSYMIPQFILMSELGLTNTLWSIVALQAFGAFGVFLMKQFYETIPEELSEAARIDGLSEYGIWRRIMLPLSMPAIASLSLLTFVTTWNDYLGPLIYLRDPEVRTIQLGLRRFIDAYNAEYALILTGSVLSVAADRDRVPARAALLRRGRRDHRTQGVMAMRIRPRDVPRRHHHPLRGADEQPAARRRLRAARGRAAGHRSGAFVAAARRSSRRCARRRSSACSRSWRRRRAGGWSDRRRGAPVASCARSAGPGGRRCGRAIALGALATCRPGRARRRHRLGLGPHDRRRRHPGAGDADGAGRRRRRSWRWSSWPNARPRGCATRCARALYLAVRRWYFTGVSLVVLVLLAQVIAVRPAIGLGLVATPLLYMVWAGSRYSLRPALDPRRPARGWAAAWRSGTGHEQCPRRRHAARPAGT